ncbi:hypothetical protein G6F22_014877 [Rhizopus arrhizus]|nr:hypothetical protein G6F22_014877 [Rhizopus arrhizus]
MANLVGTPREVAVKALPKAVSGRIHGAVQAALSKSAQAALWSMDNSPGKGASTRSHKLAAATSGAVGGAFGFAALFIELPVSTTIMMRAVADVARSEGFDLSEFSTRQACLEVFALGGNSPRDDASETGYYLARGFTTDVMRHLSAELAGRVVTGRDLTLGVAPKEAGKLLAKMVEKVAARFGVVVTEKFAAQAVPIVGAAAGATLNTMFTDYYQDMARGHFIVRRLERKYGEDVVRACYDRVAHGGVLIEPTLPGHPCLPGTTVLPRCACCAAGSIPILAGTPPARDCRHAVHPPPPGRPDPAQPHRDAADDPLACGRWQRRHGGDGVLLRAACQRRPDRQ